MQWKVQRVWAKVASGTEVGCNFEPIINVEICSSFKLDQTMLEAISRGEGIRMGVKDRLARRARNVIEPETQRGLKLVLNEAYIYLSLTSHD